MPEKFEALKAHLYDLAQLSAVTGLLSWDQQTYMPPAGAKARGAQMATLSRISHERFTSDETARLLEAAAQEVADAPYDSDEAAIIRVTQHNYDQYTKLPAEHVSRLAMLRAEAHQVWAAARASNDFASFVPVLRQMIDLARERADYLGYDEHPYDALLGTFERGMTAAQVKAIFDGHKPQLVELIAAIREVQNSVDDALVHQQFDIDRQREFALMVIRQFGFDFERGRQDVSVHPFASGTSRNDVRITTRFNDDFLNPALFGMMHEAGHGMHSQGLAPALDGMPAARYTLSVGESQSRTWENLVGRSRAFWQWAYPHLQQTFPAQFGDVSLDAFYKAINKVQPSYIRVEADEATYNLHIMLRFELEMDMIAGHIPVEELPEAWNSRFESYLGLVPPNDTVGVLQDVHWSSALIGYFPTYALGNLLSVQFFNQALKDHPNLHDEFSEGKFDTLLNWLREHIHGHGGKFTANELAERVTGTGIDPAPYMAYLNQKFSDIYSLG